MDINLILLIVTTILFIALIIFDFAFFRFRERRFEDGEPLSILLQSLTDTLKKRFAAMQIGPDELVEENGPEGTGDFSARRCPLPAPCCR